MLKRIVKKFGSYILKARPGEVIHVKRPYQIVLDGRQRFKGKTIVVTGGSGTIGRAICYRLASEGAEVFVAGSRADNISRVVNEIVSSGLSARPLQFDLSDEASIEDAFSRIPIVDTLVCCAGGGARDMARPFEEQSSDVIRSVIDINLCGTILSVRQGIRKMLHQGRGNVILISSTVGVCGLPRYSEYAAAKSGIIGFAKSLAMEFGTRNIRVNCVSPGIVEREPLTSEKIERLKRTNWLKSYGKPEDIASMVAYLTGDEASFITGQNFIVDGGRSVSMKGL